MHSAPRTNWYRLKQEQDRQELSQLESEYQKRVKNLEEMDDKRKMRVADKVKQQHSQAGASPGRQRAGTVGGTTTTSSSNKSWSSVVKDTPATSSGTSSTPSTPSTLRVETASSPGRASRAGGSSHRRQRSNGSATDSPGRTRGASPSRSSIQAGTVRKMQGSFNSPTGSPTSAAAPTTTTTTTSAATATPSSPSTAKVSYAKAASSPTSENRTRLATRSATTATARSTSPSTTTTSYAPYAASAAPYSPASASAAATTRTRIARSPSTVSPAISAIASTFSGPNSAPSSARSAASPSSPTTSAPSSARASSPTPARSATSANVRTTPTSSPRTTTTSSPAAARPSITVTTASSPAVSRSALSSPTAVPASPSATRSRSVASVVGSRPTSPPSVGSTPTASPRGPSPTIASSKKTSTVSTPTVTTASSRTAAKSSSSASSPSSGTSSPAKSPTIPRSSAAKSTSSATTTSTTSKLPTPGKVTLPAALIKGTKLEMRGSTLVHAHGEQVLVWNIAEQECILQFSGHSAPVHTVAVRNENVIVSSSAAETLVWDAITGKVLHSADGSTVMSAHPSLEQIIIATKPEGAAAPKLQILHLPSLTLLQSLDVNSAKGESLQALAWSSDTQLLLAVGSTVKHLDLKAKSFSASFTGHSGAIVHIECFSNAKGSATPTHFFSMCDQGQVLCFHLGSAKIVSKTSSRGSCSTLFILDDRNSQKLTSQLLPILIHPEGITTIAAKDDSIKMNDPDSALPIDVITASTPVLLL